jgi:hypothetical protein
MSFRRSLNNHDIWQALVREHVDLLAQLPPKALESEQSFRDYVTKGVHDDLLLVPSVFQLSSVALESLWRFINEKAHFDMDAILFDNFNEAYRKLQAYRRSPSGRR